ncbi:MULTISPECIES: ASCH domain-containing protein [unclassified Variovorax]|uniref:ASCH domain-containing protein n=1 Tax=unclassified Variovorax TaxID=663243 RepID=UPI0013163403|nr:MULTISPECIES: ASCH domain-containing protein [unclassified Variovorax]VTU42942.1 ASCH domain protein [Variovorax sp. PBL-H6]VTU43569.1 ASCH domain protein [Variovorax sp. SRS16]VTU43630.1 ASCH domain protein [Variovorax sp. PBL-E5]
MKALSIQQPWAWLIVHGHKPVENRTWRTKHRGAFLVHAGKKFDRVGYDWVRETFPEIAMPAPGEFELGGIVGQASVVDCVEPGSRANGAYSSKWYFNEFGFVLDEAVPLPFVALKGNLNFFNVESVPLAA